MSSVSHQRAYGYKNSVTYPDIVSPLDQHKRQAALLVGKTDPDLAVHQKPMVHVYDLLLDAVGSSIHFVVLLAFAPCQTVNAQQVPILGLHNMFFGGIAIGGT